jgi:integrase
MNAQGAITITEGWKFYIEQWVIPQKCDLLRTREIARWSMATFGPRTPIEAVTVEQLEASMDAMVAAGKASGTRRRRLTIHYAMCNFNAKKKRVREFAKIMLPAASPPVQRSFEEEEVARLFAEPMPYRIWLFFVLDFETAARSKALEQLTYGRCDFTRRVVDYRLPGVNHKNKRRGEVAMSDYLFEVLWAAATKFGPPWKDDLIIPPGEYRPVAPNARRKPYDPMAPVRTSTTTYPGCARILKRCGLKERRIARHVGRKTWATLAAASGASHLQIGNVMHDTVATIEKSYVFIRVDKTHGLMNRVSPVAPRAAASA